MKIWKKNICQILKLCVMWSSPEQWSKSCWSVIGGSWLFRLFRLFIYLVFWCLLVCWPQVLPVWFIDVYWGFWRTWFFRNCHEPTRKDDKRAHPAMVQEQSALVRLLVEAGELEPRPPRPSIRWDQQKVRGDWYGLMGLLFHRKYDLNILKWG